MSTARRISGVERRLRLADRHFLRCRGASVEEVVDGVVALHASDPASIFLAVLARMEPASVSSVEEALYVQRSVVRTLAMRRTLWVVASANLGMVESSSARTVAATERRKLIGWLADSGVADPELWLDETAELVATALADEGLSARQLTAAVPRLAQRITVGAGTKHPFVGGATSRVLMVLAAEGRLVRGGTTGSWTGRQYEWHRRDRWLEDAAIMLDPDDAAARLAHAWLSRFGPARFDDLRWWTGWTAGRTRAALDALAVDEVRLDDGADAYVLATDRDPPPEGGSWAALLPALDPTAMGWKERGWYVGDHSDALFDRNGNIGPTVWIDGRIVGGWAQRPDGAIAVRYLEPVDDDDRALVAAEQNRLQGMLGETVVKPSFPTPLQKELATGGS